MGGPAMAKVPFIGLSATPWSRGLGKFYDDLIIAATTKQLIAEGFLSPFVAYAPSNPDLSGVSTVAGDFKQDELGEAIGHAADHWRHCQDVAGARAGSADVGVLRQPQPCSARLRALPRSGHCIRVHGRHDRPSEKGRYRSDSELSLVAACRPAVRPIEASKAARSATSAIRRLRPSASRK